MSDDNGDGKWDDDTVNPVQWAQLLPYRCPWQEPNGVFTSIGSCGRPMDNATDFALDDVLECISKKTDARIGELSEVTLHREATADFGDGSETVKFTVRVIFDNSETVAVA